MREIFFKKLQSAMREDERLYLLVGDTGFNLVEPIFEEFPKRTLNVGIAEQNLIGISAGLCNTGFRPICYAISNFLVHRCLEQVRNDVCLHNYPVVLVGTSAGYDNGGLGATHHVIDDIGCLKSFPNLALYSPSSKESIEVIFDEVMKGNTPAYIRIAKSNFSEKKSIEGVNRFLLDVPESTCIVISHGKIVKNAYDAAEGKHFSVYAIDKIKPLNIEIVRSIFKRFSKIVVAEDNFRSGLFNSLCQVVIEEKIPVRELYFLGPDDVYEERAGDVSYLLDKYRLTSVRIREYIGKIL